MPHDQDAASVDAIRVEIIALQAERSTLTRRKLTFVITAFGLGTAVTAEAISNSVFLLLAPLIALTYDLYILGADFGIKRCGSFLRETPGVPPLLKQWEQFASSRRDPFSFWANLLMSVVTLGVSLAILYPTQRGSPLFHCWLWLNVLLLTFAFLYSVYLRRTLDAR